MLEVHVYQSMDRIQEKQWPLFGSSCIIAAVAMT